MIEALDVFDNREKALVIWIVVLLAVAVAYRETRPLFGGVVRSLVAPKLLAAPLVVLAYLVLVVASLAWFDLWTTAILGMTIFWIATAGAAAFVTSATKPDEPALMRRVVGATIAWTLFAEFVANLYVFSLPVEIILVPVITFVVLLDFVAGTKPEFAPAKTLTSLILIGFAAFLFVRAGVMAMSDPASFVTSENAMRLLLPVALTLAFIPAAYLIAVYVLYEDAFLRLNVLSKDPRHAAIVKRSLLRVFWLKRMRLGRFTKQGLMRVTRASTRKQVEDAVREFELEAVA
jgi:hypothetical protein